jgi:virginiamycin B lyase
MMRIALILLPLLLLSATVDNTSVKTSDSTPIIINDPVEIKEWLVPYEASRPRDPYVGNDGSIWFVGQRTHYVARFDPQTKEFKHYPLEDGAGPHNLIVDTDGMIWYAGNTAAHIGHLNPVDGSITKIPMPDPAARDPHTLIFDQNGDIWFTLQGSNMVGKLTKSTKEVQLIKIPVERSRPYGIIIDANNRPWFNLFGTNKIATVDPSTMELDIVDLPREDARTRRIGITTDQKIWYVDYAKGKVGYYNPANKSVKEWDSPGGEGSRPYAMSVDKQDRIWFVESGPDPNMFVGFDPATETFISSTPIPSGGGTVRHMVYDINTGLIWFGTDTNYIGYAKVD